MGDCHQVYHKISKIVFGALEQKIANKNSFAIIDKEVFHLHKGHLYNYYITDATPVFLMEASEANKIQAFKEKIEEFLFEKGCKKDSQLIAIGGGVITDIAGFAAATFMRGIQWVAVPTTLLGMVDAAIGGKTGINTRFGKNTLGAIHMPEQVFIDYSFLKTLSAKDHLSAMAEVIKYALISDKALFHNLLNGFKEERDIPLCIEIKQKMVAQDIDDSGIRKSLNFGHTIAHAIEAASGFTISHGFAVAKGLLIESFLSYRIDLLDKEDFARIEKILLSFNFPSLSVSKDKLKHYLMYDKKNKEGNVHFTLLKKLGKVADFGGGYSKALPLSIIEEGLTYL